MRVGDPNKTLVVWFNNRSAEEISVLLNDLTSDGFDYDRAAVNVRGPNE